MFKDGRRIAIVAATALVLACSLAASAAFGAAPAVTVTGILVAGQTLSGGAGVLVQGTSPSADINSVTLTVDGVQLESSSSGSLWLDTGALADGTHYAVISAGDGTPAGTGEVWQGFIQTANAPQGGVTTIAGDAGEGQTLVVQTSGWAPAPAAVSYQWQRCDLAGDPCTPIAGATQAAYAAVAADDYGRLQVAVTATDTGGSTTITSGGFGPVADLAGATVPALVAPLGSALGHLGAPAGSAIGSSVAPPGASGTPGAASGLPKACRKPRLRAKIGGNASVAVAFGRHLVLRGSLRCAGAGLKGALLRIELTPAGAGTPARVITVRTGSGGSFAYGIPPGPSRRIRVTYRVAGGSRPAASAAASVVVTPQVSLAITPATTSNGHTITFAGRVSGGHEPPGGLPLELEYLEGRSWVPYRVVRTDPRDGRFHYRYTFRRTTESITYTFRFVIPSSGVDGYPFAAAASPARSVHVVP
jgi:hypothetical protein